MAGDEHLDMLGGAEWGQREATPPRDAPLPSFGFTQEQVACVCEVSALLMPCMCPKFKFVILLTEMYRYLYFAPRTEASVLRYNHRPIKVNIVRKPIVISDRLAICPVWNANVLQKVGMCQI